MGRSKAADVSHHAIVLYDEDSLSVRLYKMALDLWEDFVELTPSRFRAQAAQMLQVERYLQQRITSGWRKVAQDGDKHDSEADILLKEEDIVADEDEKEAMKTTLDRAFSYMNAYEQLVETLRAEKYDKDNRKHEKLLLKMWTQLLGKEEGVPEAVSKQWKHVGFQGDDPSTDFRGMGILSLHQVVFFAQFDGENAKNGQLKNHFYNTLHEPPTIDSFHLAYCRIFTLFADFWKQSNPTSIMDFNNVRTNFERNLSRKLNEVNANLLTLRVENLFT